MSKLQYANESEQISFLLTAWGFACKLYLSVCDTSVQNWAKSMGTIRV